MSYGESVSGYYILFMKRLKWPELATFRTKALNFTCVIHSNWLAKIELRGLGPPPRQYPWYLLFYAHAKKLKVTETEETIGFFVTFLSFVAFQLGRGAGPLFPLAMPVVPVANTSVLQLP